VRSPSTPLFSSSWKDNRIKFLVVSRYFQLSGFCSLSVRECQLGKHADNGKFHDCFVLPGLKSIARCTKLRLLKIGYCMDITDAGLVHIGATCKNLREFDSYRFVLMPDPVTCISIPLLYA
jgi:hypothetical protein